MKREYSGASMAKEIDVAELRRALGIRKLKNSVHTTDPERAAVEQLRQRDKQRIAGSQSLKS